MKLRRIILGTLLCLALSVSALVAIAASSRVNRDPVYSVAAVQAHLERNPRAWSRRPVLVRGFLEGCPHPVCPGHEPNVAPPLLLDLNQPADSLPLAWAGPDPLCAVVRRMPLLGAVVPVPQVPHWGAVATYRVQLRARIEGVCPALSCYEALVLDTAPRGSEG